MSDLSLNNVDNLERILQDIQRKNWEKKKEEEATANLIKQLQIQDEKDRLANLASKPPQKPVKPVQIITKKVGGWEHPPKYDADGFQVVQRKRSNQSQVWSKEFPSLEAQEQFDPTTTNARIRRLNKQERAMKEELDQIDEEKRQLQKDLNLWESKKRENETIEKMIKHQEESRKIRLVSQDQVQAPELGLIQPQVPENLCELMSATHQKKVRAEIKRSVREITSLQERLNSLKVRRENIKDYENERSAMGSELKERRMMSEMLEKQNYVKEGGVVVLQELIHVSVVHQELINLQNGQQGLKRQKNLSENSDEVLALGKKAVLENTRFNSKPWQQASINKKKK
ncbi:uncharacterized protein LOC111713994 [Eurytemora carolleeae]|uniref:uncharacterized protein LOC111713994 n=1 Tax=Eurytemora carolleeae TaxID=1294199 RepID=UPI000C7578E2|nr:uncharacterized protein LOC111713994 [Eurytemora carolleeae]|eukprot:XP_023344761.1 uncharacterized protein LOC111713994 [Eurytemora affinis]